MTTKVSREIRLKSRPAEFKADLVNDKPAIRPGDQIHRYAERLENLAPAALEIAEIVRIIHDALGICILQVNTDFQQMIIRFHNFSFYPVSLCPKVE